MASPSAAPCARPRLSDWRQAGSQTSDQTDLPMYQGDTFAAIVEVENADGTPADLTGYTVASQIRRGPADLAPEITAVIAAVILPPGSISLSLTAEQTSLLPIQENLYWDLELTAADDVVTTVLSGSVLVTP